MERKPPVVPRWGPLAGVAALFAAVVAAATLSSTEVTQLPDTRPEPSVLAPDVILPSFSQAPMTALPGQDGSVLPVWLGNLLTGLCVAAFLVVIGLLVWFWLKDRLIFRQPGTLVVDEAGPVTAEQRAGVRAAVEEGLADLADADADPRRAVIACWVRLEEAAAAAGTPRSVGDTSTELVTRLLETHQVSPAVLSGLATVYRSARYATHSVDERMRDDARAALRQLRDELAVPVRRAAPPAEVSEGGQA